LRGGELNAQEIQGLTFDVGRVERVNQRDSSDYEKMAITTTGAKGIVSSASNGP
jgi:hypothetical protein